MKNWILYALIGVVTLIILGYYVASDDAGVAKAPATNTQTFSAVGNVPVSATATSTGTVGQPDRMNAAQCRGTCRNVCGGSRPVIRVTRKQKDKGRCWDNCRSSYCRWVSPNDLNG